MSLIIDVRDEDAHVTNSQLVDRLFINHTLGVGITSRRKNHTSRNSYVTMDLTVTVLCAQYFEGPHCTACVSGFTGPHCDVDIDDCIGITCSGHGECIDGMDTYTCNCSQGFTGEQCDINIDDCLGVSCCGNAQCVDAWCEHL